MCLPSRSDRDDSLLSSRSEVTWGGGSESAGCWWKDVVLCHSSCLVRGLSVLGLWSFRVCVCVCACVCVLLSVHARAVLQANTLLGNARVPVSVCECVCVCVRYDCTVWQRAHSQICSISIHTSMFELRVILNLFVSLIVFIKIFPTLNHRIEPPFGILDIIINAQI